MDFPLARSEELVVQRVAGELVVYDLRVHKVHRLSGAIARVFELSDGKTAAEEVARALNREFDLPPTEDLIIAALEKLDELDLLASRLPVSQRGALTRRVAFIGAAGLFAVVTIVATEPGAHASASAGS